MNSDLCRSIIQRHRIVTMREDEQFQELFFEILNEDINPADIHYLFSCFDQIMSTETNFRIAFLELVHALELRKTKLDSYNSARRLYLKNVECIADRIYSTGSIKTNGDLAIEQVTIVL